MIDARGEPSDQLGEDAAPMLEILELIEAGARGRQQDCLAGTGGVVRELNGGGEIAAMNQGRGAVQLRRNNLRR
jgi:hypothetical protein